MLVRFASLLALLLGTAACVGDADDAAVASHVPEASASRPVAVPSDPDAPPAADVRPGVRLDRILAEREDDADLLTDLRAPRTQRTEPVPNEYVEGQVDTVRTYVYDGLRIEAYEVAGGRTFIRRVDVTDGSYGTASGLSVGETRETIERVLGRPVRDGGRVVVYEAGPEPTPTSVEVTYEPDEAGTPRASAISWLPYLD